MISVAKYKALIISAIAIILFSLFAIIQSCKKLEIKRDVKIETGQVSDITINSASITGVVLDVGENGIAQHGHCWSTEDNPTRELETRTSFGRRNNTGTFNSALSGLSASTMYNIRAYAISSEGMTIYGDNVSFTTYNPSTPTVTTNAPSDITDNSATCGGEITSDGGTPVIVHGVCWSTNQYPTLSDDYTIDGMGAGSFTSNITGLTSGTKYYVRAYATNSVGTNYGNELNFTTISIIDWQRSLGGSKDEIANCVQQTIDGGYIIAGWTKSNDGDVSEHHGGMDYWIVKLTSTGAVEWQKTLGGSEDDKAWSIQQTADGGYIIAGYSHSDDGDVSGNNGSSDYWIVKINSAGDIEWQKSFGGSDIESANCIQITADEGYIIGGYSHSDDGDVSVNHGLADYWVVKLTSTGDLKWEKSLGGSEEDQAWFIQQTMDGSYIVAGHSCSNDGDVTVSKGEDDFWIVMLDSTGNIEWQKSFGGQGDNRARSIRQTVDGGYIVTGESNSSVSGVTEYHKLMDYYIVKLTSTGEIEWQKALGGDNEDLSKSIQQTSDNGYVIAGWSESNDGDVSGNHGGKDYWIVKITATGNIEWQKSFGGKYDEITYYIKQTTDGGYIIAGYSASDDGNVSENHGGLDYWIVKIPDIE